MHYSLDHFLSDLSWQFEEECRSLTGLAFGPNFPAMLFNDYFYYGETDSGTLKFPFTMQSSENSKKFIIMTHIEAGSVIPDAYSCD